MSKYVPHPNRRPLQDPLELLFKGINKLYSIWVNLIYPFAFIGRKVSWHITSELDRQRATRISIGNSVKLRKDVWLNVATEDPTGEPVIVIEDNCALGNGTIVSAKNRIHLERDVIVGQQVAILDHNHAYEDITVPIVNQGVTEGGRIRIGQGTWIGRGSAIICSRGELTIGRHCVVGLNSMVLRSIPDYSVVFGSPATIIRQYDPETRTWLIGSKRNRNTQIPSALSVPPGK